MSRLLSVVAVLLLGVLLVGCEEAKAVSADEFRAMLAGNPESMRHTEFVGVRDGKAYLKVHRMAISSAKQRWEVELYSTDASQLPAVWLAEQTAAKAAAR